MVVRHCYQRTKVYQKLEHAQCAQMNNYANHQYPAYIAIMQCFPQSQT